MMLKVNNDNDDKNENSSIITPEIACINGTINILKNRMTIIQIALNCVDASTSRYWNSILYDIYALYRSSVAQSIVNYILQDEQQRRRALIKTLPLNIPTFGWGWKYIQNVPNISLQLKNYINNSRYNISHSSEGSVLNNMLLVDVPSAGYLENFTLRNSLTGNNALPNRLHPCARQGYYTKTAKRYNMQSIGTANFKSTVRNDYPNHDVEFVYLELMLYQ